MIRSSTWHAANGDVIQFDNVKPFIGTLDTGTPGAVAQVTRGVQTDGQRTGYVTAEPLTPILDGAIFAENPQQLDRLKKRLQAALNPKHFGMLIYHDNAGSYRLRCRPIAGAAFGGRVGDSVSFSVDFISDDPYWVEADEKSIWVGMHKPLWVFPWVITPPYMLGELISNGVVSNPTYIDIAPVITVSSTESTSVTIGNSTTGEATTITQQVLQGENIVFDMAAPSAKIIHADGGSEDVTHWITVDSTFPWACVPGDNEIYCAVDNPELSPMITLKWHVPEVGL